MFELIQTDSILISIPAAAYPSLVWLVLMVEYYMTAM
jgi:hypothetical protein